MRRVQILRVAVGSAFVAGCNVGGGQDSSFIDPGKWEIVNGVPGYEVTDERCLSPEEIAKPNLAALHLDNPGCSKDRFSVSGGKIQFESACAAPDESSDGIRMRGEGHYDRKSFEIDIHRQGKPDAAIRGVWKGECSASDK
jgi:hypothetical protein